MNRCDSGTDSIVWMEEDVKRILCRVFPGFYLGICGIFYFKLNQREIILCQTQKSEKEQKKE